MQRMLPINYPIPCMVLIKPEAQLLCFSNKVADADGNFEILCGLEKNKRIYTKKSEGLKAEFVPDQFVVKIEKLKF